MLIIKQINKIVSIVWGLVILTLTVISFIMNTITEWETILYVTLITIFCWITNYKCNFFVKLSAIFILSVLCHIAFINVNLDLEYMYEDLVMGKKLKTLYLMYGCGYIYCLYQQWILFFRHAVAQSMDSICLSIIGSIGFFYSLGMIVSFPFFPSNIVIYGFPIIHYSTILITGICLLAKKEISN